MSFLTYLNNLSWHSMSLNQLSLLSWGSHLPLLAS
jgi:hypothetical protein